MKILMIAGTLFFAANAFAETAQTAPNPMLDSSFKQATGSWTCKGTMKTPTGSQTEVKTTGKIAKALGGHQYVGEFSYPKSDSFPAMKSITEWHYDPTAKTLVANSVSDNGDASRGTSNGLQGQAMVWTSEGTMGGTQMKSRSTQLYKNDKEMTMSFEAEVGGNWTPVGQQVCKKD
ncbi:MAG: hypothetical protein H7Z43_12105 [Clostridia bacterium]|nr:hypothetical protein [Deltaproteobacteria bacterium]